MQPAGISLHIITNFYDGQAAASPGLKSGGVRGNMASAIAQVYNGGGFAPSGVRSKAPGQVVRGRSFPEADETLI